MTLVTLVSNLAAFGSAMFSASGNLNIVTGTNTVGAGNLYLVSQYNTVFNSNVNTETMVITASGNVGIGTVSPSANLHSSGTALFSGLTTFNGCTSFPAAPTFSGNPTFSGTPTFSGSPVFSGAPTFNGVAVFNAGPNFYGNPLFSGSPQFTGAPVFTNILTVNAITTQTGSLVMNNNRVVAIASPICSSDATNKSYVDSKVSKVASQIFYAIQ